LCFYESRFCYPISILQKSLSKILRFWLRFYESRFCYSLSAWSKVLILTTLQPSIAFHMSRVWFRQLEGGYSFIGIQLFHKEGQERRGTWKLQFDRIFLFTLLQLLCVCIHANLGYESCSICSTKVFWWGIVTKHDLLCSSLCMTKSRMDAWYLCMIFRHTTIFIFSLWQKANIIIIIIIFLHINHYKINCLCFCHVCNLYQYLLLGIVEDMTTGNWEQRQLCRS